ncbi:MAG: dihydroxy-acid dehydratase, partial [Bacteroidota bacterium]
ITIDAVQNTLTVDLSPDELTQRRAEWNARPISASTGALRKYAQLVSSASEGCVTDEFELASATVKTMS